jgi:hypothetical protein
MLLRINNVISSALLAFVGECVFANYFSYVSFGFFGRPTANI